MQSMVPQYLEASMEAFRRNQSQFRQAIEGTFASGPFAEIAKRNMEIFEAAAKAFKVPGDATQAEAAPQPAKGDDLSALKDQLAALQAKLDKIAK
jgi:polyhydroxyalkanoate synthesis regulator protein